MQRRLAKRRVSPVVATAKLRVVGMFSACMASLMMYSRSIGPSAGTTITATRVRRRAWAFELDVEAFTTRA